MNRIRLSRRRCRNYYRALDAELGETLACVDEDTTVMVVSDHGAKRMDGGICVNEWLRKHGYLTLKTETHRDYTVDTRHSRLVEKTKAWGEGGYYGRIFINVEGREPNGIVSTQGLQKLFATN